MGLLLSISLLSLFAFPPRTVQAGRIRAVDFRNFTYSWYPTGRRPPTRVREVRLRDGEYEVDRSGHDDDVLFSLVNVSYADLTKDGEEEAIVTITGIFNPNGSQACVFIYSMRGAVPRLLWKHETGNRAFGGLRSIRVAGGNLVVEQYDASFDDEPAPCMVCAQRFTRSFFRWSGKRFRIIKSEIVPYDKKGIEFLGFPSDAK